jgi:ATP-dependent 26S proteasome regulatory subunit
MRSLTVATDVAALLRARNPLLWIVTREEARVERHIFEAAASAGFVAKTWDVAQGPADISGKPVRNAFELRDPGSMIDAIRDSTQRSVDRERTAWIMRDLPVWLAGPQGATTMRALRNLTRLLPGTAREVAQAVIVLSPSGDVPPELAGVATVIDWPLPDREEIAGVLDDTLAGLPEELRTSAAPNGKRDAAIDAAVGLSADEAASCYAKSLVALKRIDPVAVAKEKKRIVTRERVMEWYDPIPGGLDAVGGLDNLKAWLIARTSAYTPEARAYGLPAPKGVLLVGVPGCGKSLSAKAIATTWGVPLLKLDLGALKSKFVGESEGNLRKAFKVIEALGRCVVWLDEIEKALQGATSGSADGGVSSDALGAILNWMQERSGEAFVIATANDVSALPPELLRKGRFDEVWFHDLPTQTERVSILSAALRAHGRTTEMKPDAANTVAAATSGFTGAEIAAIVPDAMFTAFADGGREINTSDLVEAAAAVVPLAQTASEKVEALRKWATGRARPAARGETTTTKAAAGRQIDL